MRTVALLGLLVIFTAVGCGASGAKEPMTTAGNELWRVIARADLRAMTADHAFAGPIGVTLELRHDRDRYRLVVDSASGWPSTVTFATAPCDTYAKTGALGTKIYTDSSLSAQDTPQSASAHNVVGIYPADARILLDRLPTVFIEQGGAHGGDYSYCGTLKAIR